MTMAEDYPLPPRKPKDAPSAIHIQCPGYITKGDAIEFRCGDYAGRAATKIRHVHCICLKDGKVTENGWNHYDQVSLAELERRKFVPADEVGGHHIHVRSCEPNIGMFTTVVKLTRTTLQAIREGAPSSEETQEPS